jgi:hypothetical protein
MFGEHRFDFIVHRDLAAPHGGDRLIDLAQFGARRPIGSGINLAIISSARSAKQA